jgi:hypothetical protein
MPSPTKSLASSLAKKVWPVISHSASVFHVLSEAASLETKVMDFN